jgi:ankyrin repeat protein
MNKKKQMNFYKLKPLALEKAEPTNFLANLEVLDYGENVVDEARKGLLDLLFISKGKKLFEEQISKHQISSGLRHMFYILKNNLPYTSAPVDEKDRKIFNHKLANGYKFMGDLLKNEYHKGNLDQKALFSFLETIGDGGYACAGRWRQVLEEISEVFSYKLKDYGITAQVETDKLNLKIKDLFYRARVIEGNRAADLFIEENYSHIDEESKLHYFNFFKRYLNEYKQLNLPITLDNDSFISRESNEISEKASKFLAVVDIEKEILKRFSLLLKEQIINDNALYTLILDYASNIYHKNNLKESYEDVSHYISKEFFNGFSKELKNQSIEKMLVQKNFLQKDEQEIDLIEYNRKLIKKFILYREWKKFEKFMESVPEHQLKDQNMNHLLNIKNSDGNTLINLMIESKNNSLAKLMIEKGADIEYATLKNYTPFLSAVNYGNIEIVKLLIDKGANLDVENIYGRNALMLCTDEDIFKLLIENGAKLNSFDHNGDTPLNNAIMTGNKKIIEYLIDAGADINFKAPEGKSALTTSIHFNYIHITQMLLEKGAQINDRDYHGKTPLIHAIENKNLEMVTLLLEKDSDFTLKTKDGVSALEIAKAMENKKFFMAISKAQIKQNLLPPKNINKSVQKHNPKHYHYEI